MSRFVRPETDVLTLANGDTLIVKRRLNTGETRDMRGAILNDTAHTLKSDRAAFAVTTAYLLDWTLTDDDGRPVVIRDQPADVIRGALEQLDYDSFIEIATAIGEHAKRQTDLRAEEKKTRNSVIESDPTLRSPFGVVGATNG